MPELLPHHLTEAIVKATIVGVEHSKQATERMAHLIEDEAKRSLNRMSHARGTKTPASEGGPPAKITGDLMRSVTHTPVVFSGGSFQCRIGPSSTPHSAPGRQGTTSGKIGHHLETGLRGGRRYPWLAAAAHEGFRKVPETWTAAFHPWEK